GCAQTLEVRFAATGAAEREILHHRGERQSQVADALPDLAAVGLSEQLRFRIPARPEAQLRGLVPDPRDVGEALTPGERLHPIKAEAKGERPGFGVKESSSSHAKKPSSGDVHTLTG